jgi:predicted nucleic acid-binding protein
MEDKMEDNNVTPLYAKIPVELKTALVACAKRERTTVVGLIVDMLTTGLNARSKVNDKRIKQLIDSSKIYAVEDLDA